MASVIDTPFHARILQRMRSIEGWLDEREAELLMVGAARALRDLPTAESIVEVGSYVGRSTFVLGRVAKALRPDSSVYAIDPHEGVLTAPDGTLWRAEPTLPRFRRTIAEAGLEEVVVTIRQRSCDVRWDRPIAFLYVDGLHDSASIRGDFEHFGPWLAEGAYVAFHDYGGPLTAVTRYVDELAGSPHLAWVARANGLVLLRYRPSPG